MLPMFEDMKNWLEKVVDEIRKANTGIEKKTSATINYFPGRYDELIRFLDYYCARSDNNRAEQKIRK